MLSVFRVHILLHSIVNRSASYITTERASCTLLHSVVNRSASCHYCTSVQIVYLFSCTVNTRTVPSMHSYITTYIAKAHFSS
jgi:hypothetical protein